MINLVGFGDLAVHTDRRPTLTGPAGAAVFSRCGTYRYALARTWNPGRPAVVFVMLNPSTADATANDPTVRRCARFALDWGFGGIVVVNLFGLRSPDPANLPGHPDPVGPANDQVITAVLGNDQAGPVVAAWGATRFAAHTGRDRAVLALLAARGVATHCLGTTRSGHPRHPLYVKADTPLAVYPAGGTGG